MTDLSNGQRIIKQVTTVSGGGDGPTSTTRTLYIGSLYEEELTGAQNPPYTTYYTFGGKLVGMRRANYPDGNGQLRIVGDWLGSTTLVLDTASSPNVVSKQYYKPYGEVALSQGTSRTSIGYTGQRLDGESGLMFYGARFYDPVLSFFVSADTIAPNPADPKTRNRYSYVVNNPLRYTDPTGRCIGDKNSEDKRDCENAANQLRRFGFTLDTSQWTLQELMWMIEAINDLLRYARKGAYNYEAFREMMGIGPGQSVPIYNADKPGSPISAAQCGPMCTATLPSGPSIMVVSPSEVARFYRENKGEPGKVGVMFKFAFVHELAHLMDDRDSNKYSKGLDAYEIVCGFPYCLGVHENSVSGRGEDDMGEDWAETVASEVYPGYQIGKSGSKDRSNAPQHREYARCTLRGYACPSQYGKMPGPPYPQPLCTNINGCN